MDLTIDLTQQNSMWCPILGYTATMAAGIVIHLSGVQKYLSVSKFRSCIWSVLYSTICKCVVTTLSVLIGIEIYAKYSDCDPLSSNKITKHDHILPYFLTDIARYIPGVLGLFVASIFSAALSSMSSVLNSMAGIIYNDLIKKHLKKEYSELTQSNILKLLVVLSGVVCTCLVFLIQFLGPLLALSSALRGPINGPILGMFTLGMLFSKTNAKGAFYGGLITLISMSTLMVITKSYEIRKVLTYPTKPLSIDGCDDLFKNISMTILHAQLVSSTVATSTYQQIPVLFKLSYHYYTLFGTLLTMIIGVLMTKENQNPVDESLISPFCQKAVESLWKINN